MFKFLHWCATVKMFDVYCHVSSFFGKMVLFRCILTIVKVVSVVDVFTSCSSLSPPIATLTLFLSAVNGLMDAKSLQ